MAPIPSFELAERETLIPILVAFLAVVALVVGVGVARRSPRSDRDWAADQATPARITFEAEVVRIRHLRDFRHEPAGTFQEGYQDVAYDLGDVRRVWLVLAPFARRWRGLAHSLLSFELTHDRFVAISAEARREAGESYSLVGGLFRRFEITYVVGSEPDVIGLRAIRGDRLFLYPTRASVTMARALFVDMLKRAETLATRPEFYNTLTNNCTTTLRGHVERVTGKRLPFGWGVLLPGYSDRLALENGLLDTALPIREARRHFRVDARARAALESGKPFGPEIRAGL